jgi:GntR family transcriptional repressor for pyruvate dehydrogenase complex
MEKKRAELVRKLSALLGTFPEGRLPPERDLAVQLGASRNLVREAIVTFEALGMVEVRERQGTFVAGPAAGDYVASLKLLALWPEDILTHLMEMRLVIEVPAAGMAALRRTEEELSRMRECVAHLESVRNEPDHGSRSGATWDSLLHSLVVNACHNPVLQRVYEGLASTMERYIVISRSRLLTLDGWSTRVLDEHRILVEAIAARDSPAASEALRRHLGGALERLGTGATGSGS